MLNKKTVDDITVKGKRVLVRCDFNVPLIDGKITDENRLVAALPTIKKLIADGGKVILCSHLGKPKGEPKPELSLAPVAVRLSELLGQEVKFAADPEVVGPNAKAAVEAMKDGDVILLENTRYRAEETKNGEEFSKELASLCDVFVNDAFGTAHRAHCSNVGVTKYVDTAVVGYLMEKEIAFLGNAVNNPERPFVAILGGSKVSSKISVIDNLIDKVDVLIIGGGMAYTFAKAAGGTVGDSLLEMDYLDYANKIHRLFRPDRFRMAGKVWISDRKLQNCSLMLLKLLKPLYGTDRWDASRCRILQQEPKQLQQHWLKQMQLRSSAAEIPQQL